MPEEIASLERTVIDRWRRRALLAEAQLFRIISIGADPREDYGDDEWLALTLEYKDGSTPTLDELQAARKRVDEMRTTAIQWMRDNAVPSAPAADLLAAKQ